MRTWTRTLPVLAAVGLLAACGEAPEPGPAQTAGTAGEAPAPSPASGPALAIEGEGLRLVDPRSGSARPLPFGTEWAKALAALAGRGEARTGRMEECGAGPLDYAKWEDSLTLYGQDGAFMGWFAETGGEGALSTVSGIGIGSTRAELEGAYRVEVFESTLGTEFMAGGLGGLLDGTGSEATITHLWAGVTCHFR